MPDTAHPTTAYEPASYAGWPPLRLPPSAPKWPALSEYAFKASAAALLVGGWCLAGYGLRFSRFDQSVLDGGNSFGLAVLLYLPFAALGLGVVAVSVLSLIPRPRSLQPLMYALIGAALFGLYIASYGDLYGARPELPRYLALASGAEAASAALLLLSRRVQRKLMPHDETPSI